MMRFLPSFSICPSIIFTIKLSPLLPGFSAAPDSPPFINASKVSITSLPSGSCAA